MLSFIKTYKKIISFAVIICLLLLILESCKNVIYAYATLGLGLVFVVYHLYKQCNTWRQHRHQHVAQHERFLRLLACIMGMFWIIGAILFLTAFYYESSTIVTTNESTEPEYYFVCTEFLLRSLVCSLDLFMLDIDSNVLDGISHHPYLKGGIAIQAVLSFSCTVAILVGLVFARAKAYWKLHRCTHINNTCNRLYVFFGMNDQTTLLAKSIKEHDKETAQIIIVEHVNVDDDDSEEWNGIVGLFTHRRQTFATADEIDARITFSEMQLCDVDPDDIQDNDVLGAMNLDKLKSIIQKLKSIDGAELHIFFLSDNEDDNLRSLQLLAKDVSILDLSETKDGREEANVGHETKYKKVSFHCHARRNGLNRIIEDLVVKSHIEVKIIDSANIAIELLKRNEQYQPVQLVELDTNNPTTVCSEFNALILGFDEAGQDALRFLYEFGAFVDHRSTPDNVFRSPFHCTVCDKRMKQLAYSFTTFAPAVSKDTVAFEECDCLSQDFFSNILAPIAEQLNYVVIAMGDDELGMSMAVNIFNYIHRFRLNCDLSHLRIFVRSYKPEKAELMKRIAHHYNEGYNTDSHDQFKTNEIIIPFGHMKDIYTYDMIVNEEITEQGNNFEKNYRKLADKLKAKEEKKCDKKEEKQTKEDKKKEVNKEKRISLNGLRKKQRNSKQNRANAQHALTKLYLLKKAMPDNYDWQNFVARYFSGSDGATCVIGHLDKIKYTCLDERENKVILNLACLEHLRWNASHEMMGYTLNNEAHSCDERTKKHNCLRSWQELDEESIEIQRDPNGYDADLKLYDFGVVDTTIWIHQKKLIGEEPSKEEEK